MPPSSASRPPGEESSWLAGREHIEVHGNEPWLLDDRERFWAVVAGEVDVFAVRVGASGEPGARHHVAQAGPGQLLNGGGVSPGDFGAEGMALLAVPSGEASVAALSREEVSALLDDPEERLLAILALSEWAETLSAALPEARRPYAGRPAVPGTSVLLAEGEALIARGGAACVRVTEGEAYLVSDPSMPLNADRGWVPLTSDTWLVAPERATCGVVHLAQALRGEAGLGPLDELLALLLGGLSARYRREEDDELERLQLREEVLQEAFAHTLARQASVMETTAPGAEGLDDDGLLRACRIIGGRLGVHFRPAPDSWKGKIYDPVSAVARASHVRYRAIKLDGEWWRRDCGPLLAFGADDDSPVALLPASSRRYHAHVPGASQPLAVDAAFAASLKPAGYMFYRPLPDRPLRGRDILAYVLRGSRRDVAAILLLTLLAAIIGLALPVFTSVVFTYVIPAGNRAGLGAIAAVLLVIAVTLGVFGYTRGVTTVRVQTQIGRAHV